MWARRAKLLGVMAALMLCASAPVRAASNGEGDLVTRFDGAMSPTSLPRTTPAPVSVRVSGDVESASGDAESLPQLKRITVGINRQGRLFDRGLPVCRAGMIQSASEKEGRRICGGAIVGTGHVVVQVRLPPQPPFDVRAKLLAFNGPYEHGHKLIIAQVYASSPPGAFLLVFRVSRGPGLFGTVLSTTLPPETRKWAYLLHFDMTLHRTYVYRGARYSYVSAACAAPPGFNNVLFPLARATYGFGNGQHFAMSVARSCQVSN